MYDILGAPAPSLHYGQHPHSEDAENGGLGVSAGHKGLTRAPNTATKWVQSEMWTQTEMLVVPWSPSLWRALLLLGI